MAGVKAICLAYFGDLHVNAVNVVHSIKVVNAVNAIKVVNGLASISASVEGLLVQGGHFQPRSRGISIVQALRDQPSTQRRPPIL